MTRKLLRVLGGLALMLAILAGLAAMVPAERVAAAAAQRFEALTGRALTIDGSVRLSVWPDLGVRTGPVSIANAPWSDAGPMLTAEALDISVNLAGLMGGEVNVTGFRAVRPAILLERNADGIGNWVVGGRNGGSATTATPGVNAPFTLDEASLSDGTLRIRDAVSGRDLTFDALDLTLAAPDWGGPARIDGTAVAKGQPVALTLTAGVFSALVEGRITPAKLRAIAGAATVDFDGRAGLSPLQAEGGLAAEAADLSALAAILEASAPELPAGLGRDRLSLAGGLTLAPDGRAFLRDAALELDGNRLFGEADLTPGADRPRLAARLRSETVLAIGTRRAPSGAADAADTPPAAAAASGWPDTAIPYAALGLMDANVTLAAPGLTLGDLTLGETRLVTDIDRARAVFTFDRVAAYGGTVAGRFVMNGRGGLSVGGDLRLDRIDLGPMLDDLGRYRRLSGRGDLAVTFLGVGDSIAAIMAGLEGEGRAALADGAWQGFDAARILSVIDPDRVPEGGETAFHRLDATFTVAAGNLRNSDLSLSGPGLRATGAGRIGIGARDLDYRLRPTALGDAEGAGGVLVPLLITGPWADPTFRLDLEGLARERAEERLRARAEEAEALAREALESELQDLGVEPVPGESVGDAVRRRAEEALEDEAERLLEGLLGD